MRTNGWRLPIFSRNISDANIADSTQFDRITRNEKKIIMVREIKISSWNKQGEYHVSECTIVWL